MRMVLNWFCGVVERRKSLDLKPSGNHCGSAAGRILTYTNPKFRFYWMKYCSIDNHCTTVCTTFFVFIWVFFHENLRFSGQQGEGGGYFFHSSLSLPPASQTLRYYLGDYWRECTSAHSRSRTGNLWFSSVSH